MRQMSSLFYYLRRSVAIALGGTLTAYSAWASWTHSHDVLGPLAAVSAAVLLALCERAWHDRQVIRLVLLGMLGIAAAVFSGSVVLERIADRQAARLSASRTDNLPKAEAQKALDEAKKSLKEAEAEARDECRSGRKLRCEATESREKAARARVAEARAKLVGLGAVSVETPVASVLGEWTELYHRAMPLALPLWLELAAPIVLAYGFAPGRRKAPESKSKPRRRQKKRVNPRKPAKQDGVADWCEAYRQKHGRDPKVADVTQAFRVSRTTAWRRLRAVS
jgi:hypothetical protein